jgi:hypothetical protein
MAVFITNWYLYKTHFKATSENSQIRNSRTVNEFYGPKRRKNSIPTFMVEEKIEL